MEKVSNNQNKYKYHRDITENTHMHTTFYTRKYIKSSELQKPRTSYHCSDTR